MIFSNLYGEEVMSIITQGRAREPVALLGVYTHCALSPRGPGVTPRSTARPAAVSPVEQWRGPLRAGPQSVPCAPEAARVCRRVPGNIITGRARGRVGACVQGCRFASQGQGLGCIRALYKVRSGAE